VHFIRK